MKIQNATYRPQIRKHLTDALNYSQRTERNLQEISCKASWYDDDDVRDPLREATRDTVEIDSSRLGERALEGASELQSLQRQLDNLIGSAGNTSSATVRSLSTALKIARRANAPRELQKSIREALEAAQKADAKGEAPKGQIDALSGNANDVKDSAYEVSCDEAPGDWSGEDVSYSAESGLRYLDSGKDNLFETRFSSNDAALEQQATQLETREALALLGEYHS